LRATVVSIAAAKKIAGGMSPRARGTYPGKTTTITHTESAHSTTHRLSQKATRGISPIARRGNADGKSRDRQQVGRVLEDSPLRNSGLHDSQQVDVVRNTDMQESPREIKE
jgi:hypothetical protein